MRMKMVCDDRTLAEVANEFLALKKAQKVRERTLNDYKKYIDKFLAQSDNSLDVDVLKAEILELFADIPKTSPARFNHPYQLSSCTACVVCQTGLSSLLYSMKDIYKY